MDRRVIRVDIPPAHAGITAALRRAFEAAAAEPCDRDFADLAAQPELTVGLAAISCHRARGRG